MERKEARIQLALQASEDSSGGTWCRLVVVGTYVYKGVEVELDQAELEKIAAETKRWIKDCRAIAPLDAATTYYPPILKEHQRTGERHGSVVDFEVRTEGEAAELWGKLRPNQDILWGIQDGRFVYISLKILWNYTSAEGVTYSAIVEEVSLTGTPYFKNIGSLRDFFGMACSDQLAQEMVLLFSEQGGDEMAMTELEKQQLIRAQERAEKAENDAKAALERIEALEKKKPASVQASEGGGQGAGQGGEQAPGWATELNTNLTKLTTTLAGLKTVAASEGGEQPITIQGTPPAKPATPAAKTLKERVKEIMASEGCDEERAWELSCERYPDLM